MNSLVPSPLFRFTCRSTNFLLLWNLSAPTASGVAPARLLPPQQRKKHITIITFTQCLNTTSITYHFLKDELHRIDVAYTIINHLTDKFWEKLEVINREGMAPQEELVPTARPAVESLERIDMEEDKEGVYTICMYEMDSGTVDVKAMPCSHRYHRECIVAWLESGSSCAVCRYQLPTAN
ncbi:hypothetical protein AMTR_s00018p00215610 [Amborella trichopoda]|uniref:RING-type domain-containing protein n=1 Tax=Amborella trichopoda TaxID=13333 RepID=W1PJP9_AMBTC|nr:hypothetical protein AMTR_s00018p00215610 [Amborella trichopoda]